MKAGNVTIPCATYRLQFNPEFTFRSAGAIVDYLRELGITHCYASPVFTARRGSTHGYDVCDPNELNPELGGGSGFRNFSSKLRTLSLGLILDIVPNHMAADSANPWWRDTLAAGRKSPRAGFFDVDWDRLGSDGRMMLPVLEDHYANVLAAGKLGLEFEHGRFWIAYYGQRFPIAPGSAARGLNAGKSRAADGARRAGSALPCRDSVDRLDAIIRRQHFRLAFWKAGLEEINYRRFFDVASLVSLRMERPEVFEAWHRLVLRLARDGVLQGLRIDHPDGLRDPLQYLERLRAHLRAGARRKAAAPLYVVVEKILCTGEHLPPNWPVAGTTGYDFLNRVSGIFVNRSSESGFNELYRAFTGCAENFATQSWRSRKRILENSFAGEWNSLSVAFHRIALRSRLGADFTFRQVRAALATIIADFPVYRTYVDAGSAEAAPADSTAIRIALQRSRQRGLEADPAVVDFIGRILLLEEAGAGVDRGVPLRAGGTSRGGPRLARGAVMKFQQLTGPVMAKGVEDTAFYTFNRLISLNEVGGDPGRFGIGLDDFHRACQFQAAHWPHSLLATATHDTKRGEDVRARIHVLSELPERWSAAVFRWRDFNAAKKSLVNGRPVPDGNDEYFLYQTLVGAWPEELLPGLELSGGCRRGAALGGFRSRLAAYMLKAIRESKTHTSWRDPDAQYEQAMKRFVEAMLEDRRFLGHFLDFERDIAFFGRFNSLAQTLLKITSPGVPDIYQGTELGDFSLVDPDNRRPVDYELRRRLLAAMKRRCAASAGNPDRRVADGLGGGDLSGSKLYLTWRALNYRRAHRELFENGSYLPLRAAGGKREHVCAFSRTFGKAQVVVVVPRLVCGLMRGRTVAPLGPEAWADTWLPVNARPGERFWNVLTGEKASVAERGTGCGLELGQVLRVFPVALLEKTGRAT